MLIDLYILLDFFQLLFFYLPGLPKKITSKILKFKGDTNGMTLNRKGRWKGFSTRGWGGGGVGGGKKS